MFTENKLKKNLEEGLGDFKKLSQEFLSGCMLEKMYLFIMKDEL